VDSDVSRVYQVQVGGVQNEKEITVRWKMFQSPEKKSGIYLMPATTLNHKNTPIEKEIFLSGKKIKKRNANKNHLRIYIRTTYK
jgi:hypothetical protein